MLRPRLLAAVLLVSLLGGRLAHGREGPAPAGPAIDGQVCGYVFGPDDQPVPEVVVEAVEAPRLGGWFDDDELDAAWAEPDPTPLRVSGRAVTTSDGAFTIHGLVPQRRYRLKATGPSPFAPSAELAMAEPEADPSIALRLSPGHPLHIRVTGTGGVGLAGRISVRLAGAYMVGGATVGNEGGWEIRDVETAADGSLDIPAVPDGLVVVTAVVPGVGVIQKEVLLPAAGVLSLPLALRAGGTIEGRIVGEEGTPVPGARLAWECERLSGWQRLVRIARADESGHYRITGVSAGRARLSRAAARGLYLPESESLRGSEIAVSAGSNVTADVRLRKACTIGGTVRDRAGLPVGGVHLSLHYREHRSARRTLTGPDGRYSFSDLVPGAGWVRMDGFEAAEPQRWVENAREPQASLPFRTSGPEIPTTLDFVVKAGALPPLRGSVKDESDAPVAGAIVTATRLLEDGSPTPVASVRTDRDGGFSIPLPAPYPRWRLRARAGNRDSAESIVRAGAEETVLSLSRSASISGRVLSAKGQPLAGAQVTPCEEQGMVWGAYTGPDPVAPPVVTDREGRFTLSGLEGGRLTFQIRHRGAWLHPVQVSEGFPNGSPDLVWHDLQPGEELKDVVVATLPTAAIGGHVVDEAGRPVGGIQVSLGLESQGVGHIRGAMVATDRDGRFVAPYLIEGTYAVSAAEDLGRSDESAAKVRTGTLDARIVRKKDAAVTITSRRVAGRVLTPDGKPVPLADLGFGEGWRAIDGRALVVDGRFDVLLEGSADRPRLQVARAFDSKGDPLGTLMESLELSASEGTPIEVRLRPGQVVAGRVVDEGGIGIPGTFVALTEPVLMPGFDPDADDPFSRTWTLTDRDGVFGFTGLEPRACILRVMPPGDWREPARVAVDERSHSDLAIVLRRGSRIGGRVTDDSGKPATAKITASWEGATKGDEAHVETTPGGTFSVVVPTDAKHATVRADEGPLGFPSFGFRPGASFAVARDVKPGTSDLVLRMTTGETLRGTVVGPAGEPIPSGWVMLLPEAEDPVDRRMPGLPKDPTYAEIVDGTFELRDAPAGKRRVVAIPDGEEFAPSGITAADVPGEGVKIVLERCVDLAAALDGTNGKSYFATWRGAAADGTPIWRSAHTGPEGKFTLRLPPRLEGTLYVHGTTDDRYALEKGVSGSSKSPLSLALHDGLSMSGRVEGITMGEPEGSTVVVKGDDVQVAVSLGADSTFVVHGLPAGSYEAMVEVPAPYSFAFGSSAPTEKFEAGRQDVLIRDGGIRYVQKR